MRTPGQSLPVCCRGNTALETTTVLFATDRRMSNFVARTSSDTITIITFILRSKVAFDRFSLYCMRLLSRQYLGKSILII